MHRHTRPLKIRLREAATSDAEFIYDLIAEAKAAGKPLRLRVLSVDPARRLYEREGFRVTSSTPERFYMEL